MDGMGQKMSRTIWLGQKVWLYIRSAICCPAVVMGQDYADGQEPEDSMVCSIALLH